MVENITPLILKNTKNKKLLDNNIYINNIHTGTFYQLLNESLLEGHKLVNLDNPELSPLNNRATPVTPSLTLPLEGGGKGAEILAECLTRDSLTLPLDGGGKGAEILAECLTRDSLTLPLDGGGKGGGEPNLKESLKGQIAWAAEATGLPETLIMAVGQVESGLRHVNPQTGQIIKSPAGALGLMQLMPATANELGVNVYEQAENILGGAKYLALAWQKFPGKLELVLAGYNAGINRVQKAIQAAGNESWEAIKGQLPQETQNYVTKVMALLNNLDNPELSPLNNRATPVTPSLTLPLEGGGKGAEILAECLTRDSLTLPLEGGGKGAEILAECLTRDSLTLPLDGGGKGAEILAECLTRDSLTLPLEGGGKGGGEPNLKESLKGQIAWAAEATGLPETLNLLLDKQNVKTKVVNLNLLTGEENSIFTALERVNSGLWLINRPVSLLKLPLIIFSTLQSTIFKAGKTIIKLHLAPENLGSLAIKVTKQEDKLTIHFYTTSHNVKEIIEASFPQLKEALFQQNLLLDKAMVLITNQEQGRGQNNYAQGRWPAEQPYTPQKAKTREVNLNLLTGEENSIPKATTINYWV